MKNPILMIMRSPSMQNRNAIRNDYNNSSLHNQHFRGLHVYNAGLHVQANELKCWLALWVFSLRLLVSSYHNGLLEWTYWENVHVP